jgi:hypothetical protein
MTQTLVRVAADISTTLTTKLAVGATTGTLTSGVDADGVQLPTGTYGFTVDRSSSSKEHFTATLTGAALTDIKTVTRGTGLGTAGLLREHRKGAEVIITDWVSLKRVVNLLDGTTSFDSATPLGYDGVATISTGNQFATKTYVDSVAIAGAADSSTSTKGITKMSVAPVSATSPIAVGQNDPVVPTQAENDALVGNNTDIAVGIGNKFVTQTGLQHNTEKYAADAGANDTYVITLSPVPTSYTNGMVVHFKANTANTGAATLNVNSLGAKTIVKGVNTTLDDSDILASQFVTVIYDGTNFVLQNPVNTNKYANSTYSNGVGTYTVTAASGTQTIAHGLSKVPKFLRMTWGANGKISNTVFPPYGGSGTYNGTTISQYYTANVGSNINQCYTSTSGIITYDESNGSTQTQNAVPSWDATNITLTWTKTGTVNGGVSNISYTWEVFA